jgi:hypothetical protein
MLKFDSSLFSTRTQSTSTSRPYGFKFEGRTEKWTIPAMLTLGNAYQRVFGSIWRLALSRILSISSGPITICFLSLPTPAVIHDVPLFNADMRRGMAGLGEAEVNEMAG